MNRILLSILYFLPFIANAQEKNVQIKRTPFICSYFGEEIAGNVRNYKSSDSANAMIRSILDVVGVKPEFEVRRANIPNAAAVMINGKRYLLYNARFMNQMGRTIESQWMGISILAHEIGHHLNGHTLAAGKSRPDIELEADEFSGFVLRKMGASLENAQSAVKIGANIKGSETHPPQMERLRAISTGWSIAELQMAGKILPPKTDPNAEVPVTVKRQTKNEPLVLSEKYIAYDVYFDADSISHYYVTISNNLVKVDGGRVYMAGLMVKSNKKNYPAMFYDKQYNYLYITKNFTIENGSGKQVGYMKTR